MRDALAQLNRGRDARILELVEAIEHKDHYTVGHVHRVGEHAFEIGKRLGLTQGELRDVVLAAQMHDVGKIGVPDPILLKPGRLTDDEMFEMQKHAPRGGEIALRVKALQAIAMCVRHHHERFDGKGYPDGVAGDAIPLASRIIAVADTYDSMTSNRPYRADMGHEAAWRDPAGRAGASSTRGAWMRSCRCSRSVLRRRRVRLSTDDTEAQRVDGDRVGLRRFDLGNPRGLRARATFRRHTRTESPRSDDVRAAARSSL